MAACGELGLRAQISDDRITKAIFEAEHRRELLEAVVKDYSAYPALFGYYIWDEPKCELFPALAEVCRIMEELDPFHETHINILGNRAYEPYWGCETYDEHLTRYMDTVKPSMISYDNYHSDWEWRAGRESEPLLAPKKDESQVHLALAMQGLRLAGL